MSSYIASTGILRRAAASEAPGFAGGQLRRKHRDSPASSRLSPSCCVASMGLQHRSWWRAGLHGSSISREIQQMVRRGSSWFASMELLLFASPWEHLSNEQRR
uniref:Uncharacterized protein n=1 Tax=Triticum urartu TaxID=4572 RepID=A0A8R7JY59_TRIUA